MPVSVTMKPTDKAIFAAHPANAEGDPVPDTLSYAADHPEIVDVQPSADTLSVTVLGKPGASGVAVVTASDGTVSDTITVNIQDPKAATLGLALVIGPVAQ